VHAFLDAGLTLVRSGRSMQQAAETLIDECLRDHQVPPGFGTASTRAIRGPRASSRWRSSSSWRAKHVRLLRAAERAIEARKARFDRALPVNVDGAIAAICADLGFAYELGNAIFLIFPPARTHRARAHEERSRQPAMRQIDPKDHDYDGAAERRAAGGTEMKFTIYNEEFTKVRNLMRQALGGCLHEPSRIQSAAQL